MAECLACFAFLDTVFGKHEWMKDLSSGELDKIKARIKVFKCPDCRREINVIYLKEK